MDVGSGLTSEASRSGGDFIASDEKKRTNTFGYHSSACLGTAGSKARAVLIGSLARRHVRPLGHWRLGSTPSESARTPCSYASRASAR